MAQEPSPDVKAMAAAAGLSEALTQYPNDVAAAAAAARAATAGLNIPTGPEAEPWPPMRTGLPA